MSPHLARRFGMVMSVDPVNTDQRPVGRGVLDPCLLAVWFRHAALPLEIQTPLPIGPAGRFEGCSGNGTDSRAPGSER